MQSRMFEALFNVGTVAGQPLIYYILFLNLILLNSRS